MAEPAPELALAEICRELRHRSRRFALVGGLAVSVRAEVRFTRDVDIAVSVLDDNDAEELVYQLRDAGYVPTASVEHKGLGRLATIRLVSLRKVIVDLLFASSGIEEEIINKATLLDMGIAGQVPVARAEELLAMKLLSMSAVRLQDRIDAQRLLQFVPELDVVVVRTLLEKIAERGFARDQDLLGKLDSVLGELGSV
jgi:hypothetical protein